MKFETNQHGFIAICLGGDELNYSYIREIYDVYGIKSHMIMSADIKYISSSKFLTYEIVPGINEEMVIFETLQKRAADIPHGMKAIVFAGASDWRVRALSKHKKALESLGYVIPYIDYELLTEIQQKDTFYAICDELSIPYPKTWILPFGDYLNAQRTIIDKVDSGQFNQMKLIREDSQFSELEFPLIAKPADSTEWNDAEFDGQKKIYTIHSMDELKKVIKDVEEASYNHALLLQEMLSDRDDSLVSLTLFANEKAQTKVAVATDVLIQDRRPTAIGNPLVIMDAKYPELIDHAKRFLEHVGYEGYANFDVMKDQNGNPRFLEINPRAGRNTYYVSLAGCPFVKPQIEHYVFHRDLEEALSEKEREASNEFLFSMVPKAVIVKDLKDETKKQRALELIKNKKSADPTLHPKESLKQKIWARVHHENKRRHF